MFFKILFCSCGSVASYNCMQPEHITNKKIKNNDFYLNKSVFNEINKKTLDLISECKITKYKLNCFAVNYFIKQNNLVVPKVISELIAYYLEGWLFEFSQFKTLLSDSIKKTNSSSIYKIIHELCKKNYLNLTYLLNFAKYTKCKKEIYCNVFNKYFYELCKPKNNQLKKNNINKNKTFLNKLSLVFFNTIDIDDIKDLLYFENIINRPENSKSICYFIGQSLIHDKYLQCYHKLHDLFLISGKEFRSALHINTFISAIKARKDYKIIKKHYFVDKSKDSNYLGNILNDNSKYLLSSLYG